MKKHLLIPVFGLLALFLLQGAASMQQSPILMTKTSSQQPDGAKRRAIDASSRKIPVRLTSVRNLDTEDWLKEMEIEIENTSNRPVYYVQLVISFPDVSKRREVDGVPRGLVTTVQYGRKEFSMHPGELAKAEDIPIQPGEKVILKLAPEHYEGLKRHLSQHNLPESVVKRLRVRVDELSFGDGSGYRVGSVPFFPRSILKA
jgi:hypothetical protein